MFKKNKTEITRDIAKIVEESALSHVAFIMDGNGRWATERSLPREMGHSAGAKNFKTLMRYCRKVGIRYVTVYAFSTENWKRPKREVSAIMKLLAGYIDEATREPDVEFRFIGDKAPLDPRLSERMEMLESMTDGRPFRLNIALNYGGRAEIVHAVNTALSEGKKEITSDDVSSNIYTTDCPDPDLIVRTGAEYRISNFLLWQSAYSELYFSDKMWPDFSTEDVDAAILEFSRRKRRFGGV